MELDNDGHWQAAANDRNLRDEEQATFEFLRELQATLERLVPQTPPYTRLDPPKSLQDKPIRLGSLVAPESQSLHNLHKGISEIEDLLSNRYDPAEFGEYGTVTHHLGRHTFFRGFLDKRRTVPLLRKTPSDVIRFLEKVPKFANQVKRENHTHFGIHYHYLDLQGRRSDTVLCFKAPAPWPLFAEKHAEKAAHFPARPGSWSERRRRAVYEILDSERGRFKATEYRSPSRGAALVWQENAASLRETRKNGLEIVLRDATIVRLE